MKAIFQLYQPDLQTWLTAFGNDRSIYGLPVAGRQILEYLMDFCDSADVDEALILDFNYSHPLAESLEDSQRWKTKISYHGSPLIDSLEELLKTNSSFIGDDSCLCFIGSFFPMEFDVKNFENEPDFAESGDDAFGVWLVKDGRGKKIHQGYTIHSLMDYFNLNFHVLAHPEIYTLPGYSAEQNIHIGMNAVIFPGVEIIPPAILGDNTRLERNSKLKDGTILCNNVIIDYGTELVHSIVLKNSFIGPELFFENKIIDGSRIINPETGVVVDLEKALATRLSHSHLTWRIRCFEYVLALILAILWTPLYIITLPLRRNPLPHWYKKLSIDRTPKFWRVVFLQCSLVSDAAGHRANGVFHYSDRFTERVSPEVREIEDAFMHLHHTCYSVFTLVIRSLINRLFVTK